MFKRFIRRIISAKNKEDAIANVFYSTPYNTGIDEAYQDGLITADEHEMLLALINKMA